MKAKLGRIYSYEINRSGNRKKSPMLVKVMAVGRKNGERGICEKHVLVKMVEMPDKPFWVREEVLKP